MSQSGTHTVNVNIGGNQGNTPVTADSVHIEKIAWHQVHVFAVSSHGTLQEKKQKSGK